MNRIGLLSALAVFLLVACNGKKGSVVAEYTSGSFKISIGHAGEVLGLTDLQTGNNYLSQDSTTCLLSIRVNDEYERPRSARIEDGLITLQFNNGIEARIRVEEKQSHISFELVSLNHKDSLDLVLWGPYYTTIQAVIGETVGVVRGEGYALGIQSLNIKTLGGYPWNESDRMPAFDIFREKDSTNMHPASDGSVLYRVEAARPIPGGSSLQAYCRNRTRDRIISDFNHDRIVAPAYDDGGVTGSKIALFGCPEEEALETLGKIEIAEGLPHALIDGEWAKTSARANAAYLITSFTEDNVEQAIAYTKKAGLKYLYHYGKTFENWGHFDLDREAFPHGMEGLKRCVEKAAEQGINMGIHCLSNFVSTNDPYVTPIPDKRLAKVGSSVITEDIDAAATEIPIQSSGFFNQMKNNNLKTVMIEEELIQYGRVTEEAPWKLLDCQRGAFHTIPSRHAAGTEISKLLDHAYKVFLTNADLTIEMAEKLADLYNQTGLRQISFDGLEGNRSTGLGTYGESLMPYTWYNALSDELKNHLIIDASRTTHFFWHIYTRMNWGEPWYAGFRESQTGYRFNNQAYFKRNFMPGMLGWFRMTPGTSIEDIEWMLAKSAGYDAGYALVADPESIEKNGQAEKILGLIGDWEKLRLSNAFSPAQKEMMRQNTEEFSLRRIRKNEWNWQQIHSEKYKHEKTERQPGEPHYSSFMINNPGEKQIMQLIVTAEKCDISEIEIEINNYRKIKLPVNLKSGQILKYAAGNEIKLYDPNWQLIHTFQASSSDFEVGPGENRINMGCSFDRAEEEAKMRVEFRTLVREEKIHLNR